MNSFNGLGNEETLIRQGTTIIFDVLEPLESGDKEADAREAQKQQLLESLQDQLQEAVASEDYDQAAKLKREILETENGMRLVEKIDEEHSLPQSFQSGSKSGCGRDMHQIFACTKRAEELFFIQVLLLKILSMLPGENLFKKTAH